MESNGDSVKKTNVKNKPPVPIKTYKWEDIRRAKRRGKYPYTHLFKDSYIEKHTMEDEKKKKPSEGIKKKGVRKLKKTSNVDELTQKDSIKSQAQENETKQTVPKKIDKSDETGVPQDTEVEKLEANNAFKENITQTKECICEYQEKIDTKHNDEIAKLVVSKDSDVEETVVELKEACEENKPVSSDVLPDKKETKEVIGNNADKEIEKTVATNETEQKETKNIFQEKQMEGIETKEVTTNQEAMTLETDDEHKKCSGDISSEAVSTAESRNTESEDTYTESNIEQYLDKEEIFKSVSVTSGMEGTDTELQVETKIDDTASPGISNTLQVQSDKKRKLSDNSEMTKSNLSLYQKIKNSKFKPPTFKIPKFKKFAFNKRLSKHVKVESKEQVASPTETEVRQDRRHSESPVYIYIPLNPTPEELEKENNAKSSSRDFHIPDLNQEENRIQNTNGTVANTMDTEPAKTDVKTIDLKYVASKWKGHQTKNGKKSPALKTKGKKVSPKLNKQTSNEKVTSSTCDKGSESPVEYIYIPLKPESEEIKKKSEMVEVNNESDLNQVDASVAEIDDSTQLANTTSDDTKGTARYANLEITNKVVENPAILDSTKGATKKKINTKSKKPNQSKSKLSNDFKNLASKLEGIKKKSKKSLSIKDVKTTQITQERTMMDESKASPKTDNRRDSPVEYIYIPLKGPEMDLKSSVEEGIEKPAVKIFQEEKQILQKDTEKKELILTKTGVEISGSRLENALEVTSTMKEISLKVDQDQKEEKEHIKIKPMVSHNPSESTRIPQATLKLTKENSKTQEISSIKETIKTKWKGIKHKTEKKSPPAKKKGVKPLNGKRLSPSSVKKSSETSKCPPIKIPDDSSVEYIYIPLKSPEQETTHDHAQSEFKDVAEAENHEEVEKVTEAENVLTSNEVHSENETSSKTVTSNLKKEEYKADTNSPPIKKETMTKMTSKIEQKDTTEDKPFISEQNTDSRETTTLPVTTLEIKISKTGKIEEGSGLSSVQPDELEIQETKNAKHEKFEENESSKDTIMSKLKGLTQKSLTHPKRKEKVPVEKITANRSNSSSVVQTRGDSPVEYIFIPLHASPTDQTEPLDETLSTQKDMDVELSADIENSSKVSETEEFVKSRNDLQMKEPQKYTLEEKKVEVSNAKGNDILKCKDLKHKSGKKSPPSKRIKKLSPKSNKPPKKYSPPIVQRREDEHVEYIYIPLNPTEVELSEERERELRKKSIEANVSDVVDTQETNKSKNIEDESKDLAAKNKGAIKKQATTKPNKFKETTSKLTEDIKKFAIKLKDIKKKSKKPTFKTFKRGSKTKKVSPKTVKKPITTDGKRSPPKTKKRGDSPVEYIFIPLKSPPDGDKREKVNEITNVVDTKISEQTLSTGILPTSTSQQTHELDITKDVNTTILQEAANEENEKLSEELQKKEEESSQDTTTENTSITSTLNPLSTLKKTKEFGKKKLKKLKGTVQSNTEKKIEVNIVKPCSESHLKTVIKDEGESPKYIFIPLKDPKEENQSNDYKSNKTVDENIENVAKNKNESANTPSNKLLGEDKSSKEKEPIKETEAHYYEPISKEDEEDGLKTAVIVSLNEGKPTVKENINLKIEDSPEMNKIKFENNKNGFNASTNKEISQVKDDVIYETIQIKSEESTEKKEGPKKTPRTKSRVGENTKLEDSHDHWSKSTDHEYEPINAPPESEAVVLASSLPVETSAFQEADKKDHNQHEEKRGEANDSTGLLENRLLRIPLDKELVVPTSEEPEQLSSGKNQGDIQERLMVQEIQTKLEERITSTPDQRLRSEKIVHPDSPVLQELPQMNETMAQQENQGSNIQERLRNQAGKIRTKLKGIKKPTFTIPNPKFSPNFRRPNFQRPKFQTPKFQRPKFQTPKFQRPKFNSPKFSMPKMPERPRINFPSFSIPRLGIKSQQSSETRQTATESSADSKNIFDFRTYPRLFDKSMKNKNKSTASAPSDTPAQQTAPEFATVPRAAARKKGPVGARWVHRFSDIQYADEEYKKPDYNNDEIESGDRGNSLERRMKADLRYREALEAEDDMLSYERENQDIHRQVDLPDRWRHGSFRRQHGNVEDSEDEEMRNDVEIDSSVRQPNERIRADYEMQQNNHDEHSSVASSGSRHHRGVIEEIDSDQFFLREKGISQDNIQVGLYLSSEIRDAFRQPVNALSQIENVQPGYGSRDYDLDASDLSLTRPSRPKRKQLKKTKRIKKTPHVSQENIMYDRESVTTETEEYPQESNDYKYPPARPKRSKKHKIQPHDDTSINEQNTIDDEITLDVSILASQEDIYDENMHESLPNIIGYVEKDLDITDEYIKYLNDDSFMYENEVMKGIQQPDIIINADQKYEIAAKDIDNFLKEKGISEAPKPPNRRNKSLKSLNLSEHDSIIGEFITDKYGEEIPEQELRIYRMEHEYNIPADEPPIVPLRRTRSRSRAESQVDDDRTSRGAESIISECQEPPCVQDLRDSMGYAVIDKSKRDPPLPSAPKRRKSTKSNKSIRSSDTKFFTVPHKINDTPPSRPSRNYSTLGPNKLPRKKSDQDLTISDDKENIDVSQYIEIEEDDHSKDLQSGEVISKMKGRPLPAPPRPPRQKRDRSKETLRDITQDVNIMNDSELHDSKQTLDTSPASQIEAVEEIEVSTQTDPLPDDFCCEEVVQEPTDRIVAPTRRKKSIQRDSSINRTLERSKTLERSVSPNAMITERRVHTPVGDETITHASLLVRPVPDYPPDSYVSKRFAAHIPDMIENSALSSSLLQQSVKSDFSHTPEPEINEPETVTVTNIVSRENDNNNETSGEAPIIPIQEPNEDILHLSEQINVDIVPSPTEVRSEVIEQVPEIPEKPRRKSHTQITTEPKPETTQPQIIERIIERQVPVCITSGPDTSVEVLKAQRLQVTELDVERLNVSELQAHKILVSEIDGVSLQISELTSKSGNLVVNGLEIPSGLIQEILDRLQPVSQPPPPCPPVMEQISTQTSMEDPEGRVPESPLTEQVATQTSLDEPEVECVIQRELTNIRPEPVIMIDFLGDQLMAYEEDPIGSLQERVYFVDIEPADSPDGITLEDVDQIKSEIDNIIDVAREHVHKEISENIHISKHLKITELSPPVSETESDEVESITPESFDKLKSKPEYTDSQRLDEKFDDLEKWAQLQGVEQETRDIIDIKANPDIALETQMEGDNTITGSLEKQTKEVSKQLKQVAAAEQPIETKDSVIPKQFRDLLSEPVKTFESAGDEKDLSKESLDSPAQSVTPPVRPPLPTQERIREEMPQSQMLHGIPYPVSFYPQYMHSIPPQSFYTLRPPHPPDLSEEDIPIHPRRRRHHRRLSRSSSEEDRRAVSRRRTARSPEPTIPHLTGQLARAYSNSVNRIIRQLTSNISLSVLGTSDRKQDLQVAIVILLVLIAGLILLFGGNKTIHTHHWEYFNPPTDI